MQKNSEKTVFLDMDGTIIAKHPLDTALKETYEEIAKQTGHTAEFVGKKVNKIQREIGDNYIGWDWDKVVSDAAKSLGADVEVDLVKSMDRRLRPPYLKTYPHAKATIIKLHEEGYKLNIATHGFSCYQIPVLRSLGLLPYFSNVITLDRVKRTKTHAAFFRSYKGDKADAVMVGDSFHFDIAGPKSLGFKAIWAVFWMDNITTHKLRMLDPAKRLKLVDGVSKHDDYINGLEGLDKKIGVKPDAVIVGLDELPTLIKKLV